MFSLKTALAVTALTLASASQAAHVELVDYTAFGSYFAAGDVGGQGFAQSAMADDLSATGYVSIFGVQSYTEQIAGGSVDHGYLMNAYAGSATPGQLDISMGLMSTAQIQSAQGGMLNALTSGADLALTALTFKVMGNEAAGTPVSIAFSGIAQYLMTAAPAGTQAFIDLAVIYNNATLASFIWDIDEDGSSPTRNVDFSFTANVGDEFSIGAFTSIFADLQSPQTFGAGSTELLGFATQLDGSFAVTAIPEPSTLSMLLAGFGLLGWAVQRRKRM